MRSLIRDQLAARIVVEVGEQHIDRRGHKLRIAVERLAVRKGELGGLDHKMDEIRAAHVEAVKAKLLAQRELPQITSP